MPTLSHPREIGPAAGSLDLQIFTQLEAETAAELSAFIDQSNFVTDAELLLKQLSVASEPELLLELANHDGGLARHIPAVESYVPGDTVALEGILSSLRATGARLRVDIMGRALADIDDAFFRRIEAEAARFDNMVMDSCTSLIRRFSTEVKDQRWFDVEFGAMLTAQSLQEKLAAVAQSGPVMASMVNHPAPTNDEEARRYYAALGQALRPYVRHWHIELGPTGRIAMHHYLFFPNLQSKHTEIPGGERDTLRELGYTNTQMLVAQVKQIAKIGQARPLLQVVRHTVDQLQQERRHRQADGRTKEALYAGYAATLAWYLGRFLLTKALIGTVRQAIRELEFIAAYITTDLPEEWINRH